MFNPFAITYWVLGGWAVEWLKACAQASVHAMDDRYAHYSGHHAGR